MIFAILVLLPAYILAQIAMTLDIAGLFRAGVEVVDKCYEPNGKK